MTGEENIRGVKEWITGRDVTDRNVKITCLIELSLGETDRKFMKIISNLKRFAWLSTRFKFSVSFFFVL